MYLKSPKWKKNTYFISVGNAKKRINKYKISCVYARVVQQTKQYVSIIYLFFVITICQNVIFIRINNKANNFFKKP